MRSLETRGQKQQLALGTKASISTLFMLVLFAMFTVATLFYAEFSKDQQPLLVGATQRALINTYDAVEEKNYYIDQSAYIGLQEAIHRIHKTSGHLYSGPLDGFTADKGSECGHRVWQLWYKEGMNPCIPGYTGTLGEYVSRNVQRSMNGHPSTPMNPLYQVVITDADGVISISGIPEESTTLSVDDNPLSAHTNDARADSLLASFQSNQQLNFDKREQPISRVLVHYTATNTLQEAITALRNDGHSYHYIIDRDGKIYQYVPEDKSAQHASCNSTRAANDECDRETTSYWNSESIGISFVNCGYARHCGRDNCELIQESNNRCFERYSEEQIDSFIKLLADVAMRNPGIDLDGEKSVIGHDDMDYEKSDPGPVFHRHMESYISQAKELMQEQPHLIREQGGDENEQEILPPSSSEEFIPPLQNSEVDIPETYTIQSGDTLSGIAIRFDTTLQELVDANEGNPAINPENLELIRVGDIITLPQQSSAPSSIPGDDGSYASAEPDNTQVHIPMSTTYQSTIRVSQSLAQKVRTDWGDIADQSSRNSGVAVELILAKIAVESSGNPLIVSGTGCAGLMQFCKPTAGDPRYKKYFPQVTQCYQEDTTGPQCTLDNDDRFIPYNNVMAGGEYLKDLLNYFKEYREQLPLAIAGYNGGEGLVMKSIQDHHDPKNADWNTLKAYITEQKIFELYKKTEYWSDKQNREKKVKEIHDHVDKVMAYYQLYGGPSTKQRLQGIGSVTTKTPYQTTVNYDLSHFQQAQEVIKTLNEEKIVDLAQTKLPLFIAEQQQSHPDVHLATECEQSYHSYLYNEFVLRYQECLDQTEAGEICLIGLPKELPVLQMALVPQKDYTIQIILHEQNISLVIEDIVVLEEVIKERITSNIPAGVNLDPTREQKLVLEADYDQNNNLTDIRLNLPGMSDIHYYGQGNIIQRISRMFTRRTQELTSTYAHIPFKKNDEGDLVLLRERYQQDHGPAIIPIRHYYLLCAQGYEGYYYFLTIEERLLKNPFLDNSDKLTPLQQKIDSHLFFTIWLDDRVPPAPDTVFVQTPTPGAYIVAWQGVRTYPDGISVDDIQDYNIFCSHNELPSTKEQLERYFVTSLNEHNSFIPSITDQHLITLTSCENQPLLAGQTLHVAITTIDVQGQESPPVYAQPAVVGSIIPAE